MAKQHAHVMRSIEKVIPEYGINALKFKGVYLGANGEQRPCYHLPRFECDLVVSGYSVKYRGATWIKARIRQCKLVEGHDFEVFVQLGKNLQGGRPSAEYTLSLDTAKRFCMLEKTDQGEKVRTYFIECEKELWARQANPGGLKPLLQQGPDELLESFGALYQVAKEERKKANFYQGITQGQADTLLTAVVVIQGKDQEIAELKPKSEGFDAFLNAEDGMISIRTLANILHVGPYILFSYEMSLLQASAEHHQMCKLAGGW